MTTHLLQHLLSKSAAAYPEREAVVCKSRSITYAALEAKSARLAAALAGLGIKKGDRIGIMLPKSIESVVALFGIMRAGGVYVPLDPHAPGGRVNQMIANCGIECLITSDDDLKKICQDLQGAPALRKAILAGPAASGAAMPGGGIECMRWEALEQSALAGPVPAADLSDTSPAYILHTSGSTGMPKGVVISHLNALTFVNTAADVFSLNHDDRIANHAPLHFDLSVFDIFGAVSCGATIVIVPESLSPFPAKLAEYIDRTRITVWNSVSSVLTMLADRGRMDRFGFEALRLVHFSGDIMPVKYLRILRQHLKNAAFYNIYGQTEANSSLFYPVTEIPARDAWMVPIGKPLPNFEVFALNEKNEVVCRPGEEGELYVNSSTVALGYWNAEAMTHEKFVPDPRHRSWPTRVYRTGDLVRVDDQGNYVFSGRKDHMVKSRGYRIELAEIELVLNSHPKVSHAIVLAVPDELAGNRIIGYLSLTESATVSVEEITAYCHTLLPRYMVPEQILVIEGMPRTTTGKADRKLMTETYLSQKH